MAMVVAFPWELTTVTHRGITLPVTMVTIHQDIPRIITTLITQPGDPIMVIVRTITVVVTGTIDTIAMLDMIVMIATTAILGVTVIIATTAIPGMTVMIVTTATPGMTVIIAAMAGVKMPTGMNVLPNAVTEEAKVATTTYHR